MEKYKFCRTLLTFVLSLTSTIFLCSEALGDPSASPTPAPTASSDIQKMQPNAKEAPAPPAAPVATPEPSPSATTEQAGLNERNQPNGFYYYCQSANQYYPTVSQCPEGWIAIPVAAPPPVQAQPEYDMPWSKPLSPSESARLLRSRPNAFTFELLGRGIFYSADYDYAIGDHFALGVGFSYWQEQRVWTNYQADIYVIPVYANYYFTQKQTRGFISAGADIIQVSASGYSYNNNWSSGVSAVLGGGCEFRDKYGVLVRLGGFLILGQPSLINPSASIGYSF